MLIRIPILGNFLAKVITLSSNQPDVDITTRGDLEKAISTILSKSSLINGSPPVILINFTLGRILSSSGVISLLFYVGLFHMSHILHCIGQRYVVIILISVGAAIFLFISLEIFRYKVINLF